MISNDELKIQLDLHEKKDEERFAVGEARFAELFNELKHNTKLTEAVVQRQSGLESHFQKMIYETSEFRGKLLQYIESNGLYMKNLDDRLVSAAKDRGAIREELSYFKGVAKASGAIGGAIWGTISAIVIGVATYFFNHKL